MKGKIMKIRCKYKIKVDKDHNNDLCSHPKNKNNPCSIKNCPVYEDLSKTEIDINRFRNF
jgi:hypothetical protein